MVSDPRAAANESADSVLHEMHEKRLIFSVISQMNVGEYYRASSSVSQLLLQCRPVRRVFSPSLGT